jgi:hypothetical protein
VTDQALVTGVLADALAEQRDRCNAIVAAARRAHADFAPEVVATALRGPVRDLVEASERVVPGSGSRVLAAVFPIVTDLVAQHRLGADSGHDVLFAALPALARQVTDEPRLVVGSLANAVVHLERAGVPVERWLARVLAASSSDTATLLGVGQVAAWAAGLAPARTSALGVAATLDGGALAAALGTAGSLEVAATVERLRADRWWRPDGERVADPSEGPGAAPPWGPPSVPAGARVVARVGGFRGFGGPFLEPPVVVAGDGEIVVRSGAAAWTLHADAFGAALTRTTDGSSGMPTAALAGDALPGGIEPVSAAATGDLAAVTIASSYRILVIQPGR